VDEEWQPGGKTEEKQKIKYVGIALDNKGQ
jgi:hypothetical protein